MSEPQLLVEQDNGVVRLILNRPQKRNALNLSLLNDLQQEFTRIATDNSARVVLLEGNGPAFCAGHDLAEMTGRTEAEYEKLFSSCSVVMQQLGQLPQPVIARVHGIATAAGCQLVAACDLAVASEEAKFATPGVKIGLFCTTPMVPLMRTVPQKVALEMLLTGQPISARRAYEVGLVNRVTTAEQLDVVIAELAEQIVQSSPLPLHLGKQAFHRQLTMTEAAAYLDAVEVMTKNAVTADAQEGMTAFLEKRVPQWTGQ